MKFSHKKLPAAKHETTVEVEPQEFEQYIEKALSLLRKDFSVEGFRQGKVPKEMVQEKIGKETLFAKAVELAAKEAFQKIVEQQRLEVLGQPQARVTSMAEGKPLVFLVEVTLLPDVTLSDYKNIAQQVQQKPAAVGEKDIQAALQRLKESKKKEDGTVPELNDEFAKTLGNFENVEALQASVAEGLKKEKELQEKNRVRQEIMENIAKETTIELPQLLVQQEKQALLENTKKGVRETLKMEFKDYLGKLKKTEEQFIESLTPQAEKRLKQFLVLHAIAKKEGIAPGIQEIEEETNKFLKHFPDIETAKKQVDLRELKHYTEGVLKNEKTLQLLESFVK
tara:strand:- start:557 stop:1573 length:1017 start_codon:yes stop_codon:yes gene_type:complete